MFTLPPVLLVIPFPLPMLFPFIGNTDSVTTTETLGYLVSLPAFRPLIDVSGFYFFSFLSVLTTQRGLAQGM